MIRLAAAGFQHETNSFAARPTSHGDFVRADSWPGMTEGAALRDRLCGLNIPLGGFLDAAGAERLSVEPLLWAAAEPAGPVARDAFDRIASRLLDGLAGSGPWDGIYLDLHGAMIVEGDLDGEAELLRRIRTLVGGDLPIVVSLDLHANISPELAALASQIVIFRHYPHLDMAATGARALPLLMRMARGGPPPAGALRHGSYLVPMAAQFTGRDPARSLYAAAQDADVELAMGFPAGDTPWTGPAILAYGPDQATADSRADDIAARLEESEPAFARWKCLDAASAVRTALSEPRGPVIIADVADNPGGGATSDTMGLFRELVRQGARGAVVALVHAPDVAAAAHGAGPGGSVTAALGAASAWPGDQPFCGRFTVQSVSNTPLAFVGPMYGGGQAAAGPSAHLRIDDPGCDVSVLVTSIPIQALDRGLLLHFDLDPAGLQIIVLKSSVHYRADFEGIAARIIEADVPGRLPADLETLPYRHLRAGLRRMPGAMASDREVNP